MIGTAIQRFRSGEVCIERGEYEFDGYLDGSSSALPALEEMEIRVSGGEVFPGVQSRGKPCYWTRAHAASAVARDATEFAFTWL